MVVCQLCIAAPLRCGPSDHPKMGYSWADDLTIKKTQDGLFGSLSLFGFSALYRESRRTERPEQRRRSNQSHNRTRTEQPELIVFGVLIMDHQEGPDAGVDLVLDLP